MDDLAAGVSHELANALGAILGWTALARRQATLAPSTERAIRLIETSARSARATALRMLETARGAATALEPVELTQVLRDTCGAIEAVAAEAGVTVALDTPRECTVRGSPGHLFTLLWNLLQNAVEATAAGGRVHVRASTRDTLARVEVEDEGEGVNGSIQERIFEPYFTTKAKGTGLGLWLARRAVDEMGGTLLLEDAAGRGSRFVVELPLAARRARRATGHDRRSGVRPRGDPRGARILVVDDDRPTRELLETALRLAGAIVESAAGAEEALALEGCFDLALVDLGLKDCRGDALLAELRGRGMVRRAALVSGAPAPPRLLPEATPDTWIRKPFEIDDVIAAVRYLLVPPGEADSARGDGT